MKYSISRIIHNLFHNRLLYLFVFASFAIGSGLFLVCMNFRATGERLLEEAKEESSRDLIRIQWDFKGEFDVMTNPEEAEKERNEYPIPYDAYLKLVSNPRYTEALDILYALKSDVTLSEAGAENLLSMDLYFMNDQLFDHLYETDRQEGKAYLGEAAYEALLYVGEGIKNGKEFNLWEDVMLYINGDRLIIQDKSYPYEVIMPKDPDVVVPPVVAAFLTEEEIDESEERFGESMDHYHMDNAVVLPVEDVFKPAGFPLLMNNLYLRYRNEEWSEDTVAQVVRELNRINPKSRFTVENRYLELKGDMEDYSYDMDRWLLIAVSILFLSGVGCIGTMYLTLDKRRHFMAVSVACGSTVGRIAAETVTELFLVLAAGGLMGILLLPMLQKLIVYWDWEKLQFSGGGIGIVAAAAVVFSVISAFLGLYRARLRDVAAVLKEE